MDCYRLRGFRFHSSVMVERHLCSRSYPQGSWLMFLDADPIQQLAGEFLVKIKRFWFGVYLEGVKLG